MALETVLGHTSSHKPVAVCNSESSAYLDNTVSTEMELEVLSSSKQGQFSDFKGRNRFQTNPTVHLCLNSQI